MCHAVLPGASHNVEMIIRAARAAEVPRLRDMDWDAGQIFRDIGMPEAAEFEPRTLGELAESEQAGGLWVAVDEDDVPASFLMTVPVDGCLHVEQLSTAPAAARRGLGRALLDHAAGQARADGVPALTLTTFADVPWNGPYYERCGFRVLADDELTPGLRAIREHEIALGLDRWPRVCMRRDVTP
jgi:GNAT superfamily N-acetyltransferase